MSSEISTSVGGFVLSFLLVCLYLFFFLNFLASHLPVSQKNKKSFSQSRLLGNKGELGKLTAPRWKHQKQIPCSAKGGRNSAASAHASAKAPFPNSGDGSQTNSCTEKWRAGNKLRETDQRKKKLLPPSCTLTPSPKSSVSNCKAQDGKSYFWHVVLQWKPCTWDNCSGSLQRERRFRFLWKGSIKAMLESWEHPC